MPKERCALCGGEIEGDPVVRVFGEREVNFDTEDCARVYEAAAAAGLLDAVLSDAPPVSRGTGGARETSFFTVDGMWCASCAAATERTLAHTEGVREAEVSFALGRGRVEYDPARVKPDELMHRIERLGYRPRLAGGERSKAEDRYEERLLIQVLVAAAFGMQVMVLYLVRLYGMYQIGQAGAEEARTLGLLAWALSTPVLLYSGQSFLRGAWNALKARTADMNTLVALGTISAYAYSAFAVLTGRASYFDSVTMIVQFVMIGRYVEARGGASARRDVRALLELQPDRARLLDEADRPTDVRSVELAIGDRILVMTGERVPADARVLTGRGEADESLLTGESALVRKGVDATIWSGTVLVDGPVTAEVVAPPGSSRLAAVRKLVEQTLMQKAPAQRLADTASAYLTWAILGVAFATFAGWLLVRGSAATAILAAVAVLVVACPCALGLATPLAISVALGRATRAGVLVRVPAALETAGNIDTVAFDKTGTLTAGQLRVAGVEVVDGVDADEVLALAAGVERFSEHPLGRAISTASDAPAQIRDARTERGRGIAGRTTDGREVAVGSEAMMPAATPEALLPAARRHAEAAESLAWVAVGGAVVGFVALKDTLAPRAREAVEALQAIGVRTTLLSGDSEATTAAVAGHLGLDAHVSRLDPEGKADAIAALQATGRRVAMVGDGVNDAPALARSDLAVTVSGGTDVAGETSHVVLALPHLELVPWFIGVSKATRRVMQENLGWALLYNAIAVPLAAFGVVTPAIAAAAMAVSSLLVVGNSLRLGVLLDRRRAALS